MEPAIRVQNLTKTFRIQHSAQTSLKEAIVKLRRRRTYEDFPALQDVSLEVEQGSVLGLIGPNGSGKSTLLKCLAKILTPTSGTIEIRGRMAALLELGSGFHPELSGRDNVYMNGSILGFSRKEMNARFDEIVSWSELDRFIDNPIKTYSSGMIVRLGFAVATIIEPEVLLVDEVLAVGDMNFRRKSTDRMQNLMRSGATIVLVAHDLNTVARLCDKGAALEEGRVRTYGEIDDVIDSYRDRMSYLAALAAGSPADVPKRFGTVGRATMFDSNGEESRALAVGEPFCFRSEIDSDHLDEPANVAVMMRTAEGAIVSFASTAGSTSVQPGQGKVTIDMAIDDPRLGEGIYTWTVALRNVSDRELIDRREDFLEFVVGNAKAGKITGGPLVLHPRWSEPQPLGTAEIADITSGSAP